MEWLHKWSKKTSAPPCGGFYFAINILFTIVIATCLLSACANPLIEESDVRSKDIKNVITVIDQTEKPSVTLPVESEQPQPTAIILTPKPTAEPTPEPTPDNQNDIIPVSSAFINAAMAEINRQREAEGVAPAIFSSSISASCKNHAIAMAENGEVFHASGIYMFEAVGRASSYMPGATMGSAAVAHVTQLKSDAVTQIGIGAVYCGDYVFYVVRGD